MKINEGILPGALVKCIDDETKYYFYGIKKGQLYTVQSTSLHGACVILVGSNIPYSSERFQLIYNDRENFNLEPYVEDDVVWQ